MISLVDYFWILPIGYTGLFLVFTLIKSINDKTDELVFCTTCMAFFSMMVIGFFLKFNPLILAMMLGMSITGIAYKIEEMTDRNLFIIQLILTIIGLGVIYLLI